MHGSVNWQVQTVFTAVNNIGQSKHEAKASARESGASNWHDVGKNLGIHSYSTADDYRAVWRHVMEHARTQFCHKNIESLTGAQIRSYLQSKIDQGVAKATFGQYAAACEKLESALNRYAHVNCTGKTYSFSQEIKTARASASKLGKFEGSRAYGNPNRLVQAVAPGPHQLIAAAQRESGARINELNHLREKQLRGVWKDLQTGIERGWIEVAGKGGKVREIGVSPVTYQKIAVEISKATKGRLEFDGDRYRQVLKQASERSGQAYEGSHGLRWSWAQERHQQLQELGMTYEQSLTAISQAMGHERADITQHYLR